MENLGIYTKGFIFSHDGSGESLKGFEQLSDKDHWGSLSAFIG